MAKTERLTVSLPEELARKIKRAAKESGLKVSGIVASALKEYLPMEGLPSLEVPIRPTVLWKLKGRDRLAGPSLRTRRSKVGVWRVIELDKISV